ncbi:methyltransferase domain-containing protein [Nocardiopsis sp. CNT312]|uniref:methyltransferase domain-containing protein n=1 Tax=Nocardiopsis sp. CNT312 TaxID=1137268 RepID=UPI0004908392|nr:methyltransferase domain-containing protein [Nocardiopsis sp. CNT312]
MDDPDDWLRAYYADQPLITQFDDGEGTGAGYSSSSASMPTTVAMMLEALDPVPGARVLEIGTGTGYNAALPAARTGPGRVVSVEVDPSVADQAQTSLKTAGHLVSVITGDGTHGHPPRRAV